MILLNIVYQSRPVLDLISNQLGILILIYDRIKKEINRLLDADFIRSCRYGDWISNIVPVEKKDSGKIRVCIDFRDRNKATPKDEYLSVFNRQTL